MTTETTPSTHPLVASERVRGALVIGADGEKLGKIEEIAIDKASGSVAYAILGSGGLFGLGEHYRPIAWKDLTYHPDKTAFVVPHSRADVEAMPALPADDLSGWTVSKKAIFI